MEAGLTARGNDLAQHLARTGRLGVLAQDRTALRGPAEATLDAPGVQFVRYLVDGATIYEGRRGDSEVRLFWALVRVAPPADD